MFEIGDFVEWAIADRTAVGEIVQVVDKADYVSGIAVQVQGPAAKVRVFRDGVPTDAYVGLPMNSIDRVEINSKIKRKYEIHSPTPDELTEINKHIPNGAPERDASNTIVIPFVAADNLVNRSLEKWSIDSLQTMVDMLPGLPALLNHNHYDVGMVWGKVFSAAYEHSSSAPSKAVDAAGNRKANRQVIKKEGFGQAIANVFTDLNSPVARQIRSGFIGKVSTGGFAFSDFICPECDVSFRDERCSHIPPDKWWGFTADRDSRVALYAIRDGLSDIGEMSVVVMPNLPNAGVI